MDKLSQADINHNYKYNIINGIFAVLALNLVNPFIQVFAINLGATDFQVGLISSLPPALSLMAMLPGAFFVDRFSHKRVVTGILIFINRLFFLALALTPIIPNNQVWYLVIMYGLMNLPGSIAGVAWQSFIAGAIPSRDRARAFAHRNRLTALVGLVVTFSAGQIFGVVSKAHHNSLYQVFFVSAFLFALVEIMAHFRMREVSVAVDGPVKPGLSAMLGKMFKDRTFISFCACSLLFHFGWQMGWPLFSIYQVRHLGANEFWISLFAVTNGLMSFLTYNMWRRFSEKRGNQFVLIFATLAISSSPFFYILSRSLVQVVLINGILGIGIAGISLVLFNSFLDTIPDQNRTVYIGVYSTLISVSATLAPMVGIAVLSRAGIVVALLGAGIFRLLGSAAFALRYWRSRSLDRNRTVAL